MIISQVSYRTNGPLVYYNYLFEPGLFNESNLLHLAPYVPLLNICHLSVSTCTCIMDNTAKNSQDCFSHSVKTNVIV